MSDALTHPPEPLPRTADPMHDQIDHQFQYHTPTPDQIDAMRQLRNGARMLAHMVVALCPPSADRTAAIRLLRECVMTANASIVLGGR